MNRSLIFLGTTNIDVDLHASALPVVGRSVMGSIEEYGGGKGANQAVAAARLGANPGFATLLGHDDDAGKLMALLASFGVRTDMIRQISDARSGKALIFVGLDGANMIGIDAGANERFGPGDVARALSNVPQDAVMVVEMGLPVEACRAAFALKCGRFLIFNPAPVRAQLSEEDCAAIDILTPDETEAEELTGMTVGTVEQAMKAAQVLHERGVACVAITLGSNGAVYLDAERQLHQAAFDVEAIDTTAAGDAFNGGLATAVARDMPIGDALCFAVAVASISVTRKGAQQSMPTEAEVKTFLLARLRLGPTSHVERHLTTPEPPAGSAGSSLEPSCHEPRWKFGSTVKIRGARECLERGAA